jgi:hemerythrin superfamily protein
MSIVDKAIAAVTPPESEEDRIEATRKARAAAQPGDWLSMALDHHDEIRAGLDALRAAPASARPSEMKRFARILNGHALAEEIVLYPALAKAHEKGHANMAYTEQTATKMQMAELERLNPASKDWDDKLEHIRGALLHHIYEEENDWFLELKEKGEDQAHLLYRFQEEFERYVGEPASTTMAS